MLWALLAGCASAVAATYLAIVALRRRSVLDIPNHRSSHREPVPRGGGVALLAGCLVAFVGLHGQVRPSLVLAVFVPAAVAGVIGLADDLSGGLSVPARLAALTAVSFAGAAAVVLTAQPRVWPALFALLIGAGVVAYTNFFNFMDGINGIASAETLVTAATLGGLALHLHRHTLEAAAFSLAAATVGFLPFNFPHARVFLGDVGSYFCGAALALLVGLAVLQGFTLEAAGAPLGLFVVDATVTLARRVIGRRPWARAHREHTYQRLVDAGWSHTRTTAVVAAIAAACSALGSVSLLAGPAARASADAGIAALLVGYLALPRLVAGHAPRLAGGGLMTGASQ